MVAEPEVQRVDCSRAERDLVGVAWCAAGEDDGVDGAAHGRTAERTDRTAVELNVECACVGNGFRVGVNCQSRSYPSTWVAGTHLLRPCVIDSDVPGPSVCRWRVVEMLQAGAEHRDGNEPEHRDTGADEGRADWNCCASGARLERHTHTDTRRWSEPDTFKRSGQYRRAQDRTHGNLSPCGAPCL